MRRHGRKALSERYLWRQSPCSPRLLQGDQRAQPLVRRVMHIFNVRLSTLFALGLNLFPLPRSISCIA